MTGVIVINPTQGPVAEQDALLGRLQAAGVHIIRTNLTASAGDIAFARRAYDKGIKIDALVVTASAPDAPRRPASAQFPWITPSHPLSAANPALSEAGFSALINALDQNGVVLAALELDNEINWSDSNGDFPVPGEGKVLGLRDLQQTPEGQQIGRGYLQYIKILALLKEVRDQSRLNRRTPIILGGLYETGPEGPNPNPKNIASRIDSVSINATIQFMRGHGMDSLVDDYGIHYYPTQAHPEGRKASLENYAVSECRGPGASGGRPCWVTEWGVANRDTSCPVNDAARTVIVEETMNNFRDLARQRRVEAVLYYAWEARPGAAKSQILSIYRCNGLSRAGRVALAP